MTAYSESPDINKEAHGEILCNHTDLCEKSVAGYLFLRRNSLIIDILNWLHIKQALNLANRCLKHTYKRGYDGKK